MDGEVNNPTARIAQGVKRDETDAGDGQTQTDADETDADETDADRRTRWAYWMDAGDGRIGWAHWMDA